MSINMIVTDGTVGGINTNVVKVVVQTFTESSSTINAQVNRGYILIGVSLQTVILPSNPSVGDVFALHGKGAGLFRVVQTSSEQIILGDKQTTFGASGFIVSTRQGDELYLICVSTSGGNKIWKNDGGYGGEFLIDGVIPTNTINNVSSGDDVTLSSTGTGESLVTDGTGPALSIKSIDANLGLTATTVSDRLVLDASVASIVDGLGITSSVDGNNNVTITNSDPASNITLSSSQPPPFLGAVDLVETGTAPDLKVKYLGLSISNIGVTHTEYATYISSELANPVGINHSGTGESIIKNGIWDNSNANFILKGLSQGSNTSLSSSTESITVNVGNTLTGLNNIIVNNNNPAAHNNRCAAYGDASGVTTQGDDSASFGYRSGNFNQGARCVSVGALSGELSQSNDSICIGYDCGSGGTAPYEILLGSGCDGSGVNGRLNIGSNAEPITSLGAGTPSQQGYLNLNWNGSHYRIPVYSSSTSQTINTSVASGNGVTVTGSFPNYTIGLSAPVSVANGGTNSTAAIGAAGTIAQSDGTKYTFTTATYPATAGASGTILRSDGTNITNSTPTFPNTATTGKVMRGNGTNWVESTSTFSDTYSASNLLYSSTANTVTGLATANSAALVTNSTGVPSWTTSMTNGQVLIGSTGGTPVPATITVGPGLTIVNGSGSITISAAVRAFGEVTKSIAASSQAVTASTWSLWNTGTFSSGELAEFTRSTTRLTYTGATAKTFIAHWKISTSTTSSGFKEGAIYKNGSRLESSRSEFRNANGGGGGHSSSMTATGFSTFTLSTNDYIEPWVLSNLSENFILEYINMVVYQVS